MSTVCISNFFYKNSCIYKRSSFQLRYNLDKFFVHQRNITSKPKQKSNVDIGTYVLLTIPVITFCLGVWQIERRKWKFEIIETIDKKRSKLPQPLPLINSEKELEDLEYSRFTLAGHFDHSREIILMPRSNVQFVDNPATSSDNLSGAYVITPFILQDGRTILVNRGWVKRSKMNPETRLNGQINGDVTIVGVLRLSEKNKGQIRSHSISTHWHKRVQEEMAFELNTLPILLDAEEESSVPEGPIGGQTRLNLRNEHWQYIITWFSLSAITSYMWLKRLIAK